jgi:hypothetical protein
MRSQLKSCFSLRQSGTYYLYVADFSPAGLKIGNSRTEITLLPQATHRVEMRTAQFLSLKHSTTEQVAHKRIKPA